MAQFSYTSGLHDKLPITELKWDARTVTNIPGNTAYWFFVFFWQTKGSRNKNWTYILSRYPCAHIYSGIWLFGPPWGSDRNRQLPVLRVAGSTCMIPQNVCQCLWLITIPRRSFHRTCGDARTVTDIPGNTAYWFFVFFWQTKGSRNKN
jgi:hypothetical protein